MTDPSTPVPSDEAVKAALRVAQVRRLPGSQAAVDQIVSAALTAAAPIIAAEAAAEARAATLREMDAPGVFAALREWLAGSEALRGPGHSPEFHEGKVLALCAVRGWLDEHVPDAAHFNPEANPDDT